MSFTPWKGDNYSAGAFFGQRLLLVGESHYGPRDYPELTVDTVKEVIAGQPIDFYGWLGYACAGRTAYEADRSRFWHSVSFMNFVDELVGPNAKSPATDEMLLRGQKSFLSRIRKHDLAPDRIVVFSSRAWKFLPPFMLGQEGATFFADEPEKAWFGYYKLRHGLAATMYAEHPRTVGWSASMWRALLMRFLMEPLPPPNKL